VTPITVDNDILFAARVELHTRVAHGRIPWVSIINDAFMKWGVCDCTVAASFLAQTSYESAGYKALVENLNYSVAGLLRSFPKKFPTRESAEAVAGHPEMIAEVIYGGRMGNGPAGSGDGWKFRGRGLIQITGRSNYSRYFNDYMRHDQVNLEDHSILEQPFFAVDSALWFFNYRHLLDPEKSSDVEYVTRRINGGLTGLEARRHLYNNVIAAFDERTSG